MEKPAAQVFPPGHDEFFFLDIGIPTSIMFLFFTNLPNFFEFLQTLFSHIRLYTERAVLGSWIFHADGKLNLQNRLTCVELPLD